MKMRTRLLIAFLTFSILPIIFTGMLFSVNKLFWLYRFDDFAPEVKSMVLQMMISGVFMLVFISATGRAMKGFLNFRGDLNPERATSLLITQNPVYMRPEHKISDHVLRLPGRYDGVNFNYQLMQIFDLLRIQYYQQYYLGNA